jgi:hypothetical protein
MWAITKDGFFSVVRKDGTDEFPLCVRARAWEDLKKMLSAVGLSRHIVEGGGTDYQYRVFMSEEEWKDYLTKAVDNMDYDNFKEATPLHRQRVYLSVWAILMDIGLMKRYPRAFKILSFKNKSVPSKGTPQTSISLPCPKQSTTNGSIINGNGESRKGSGKGGVRIKKAQTI